MFREFCYFSAMVLSVAFVLAIVVAFDLPLPH